MGPGSLSQRYTNSTSVTCPSPRWRSNCSRHRRDSVADAGGLGGASKMIKGAHAHDQAERSNDVLPRLKLRPSRAPPVLTAGDGIWFCFRLPYHWDTTVLLDDKILQILLPLADATPFAASSVVTCLFLAIVPSRRGSLWWRLKQFS